MIYRCKSLPWDQIRDLVSDFRDAYVALMRPSGAALLIMADSRVEPLAVLAQPYSDTFERLSPGSWDSIYDLDTSLLQFVAGDERVYGAPNAKFW